jgi:hypothetical protein
LPRTAATKSMRRATSFLDVFGRSQDAALAAAQAQQWALK